jgi:hypothetical protein
MTVSRTAKFTLAAIVGLGLAATAIPAKATGNFDGKWSVVVVTTKGNCDRAYRYPIDIRGETLVNAGDTAFGLLDRWQLRRHLDRGAPLVTNSSLHWRRALRSDARAKARASCFRGQ